MLKPDGAAAAPEDPWGRLMARAQDGDADAYAELLREATPLIRAVVRRTCRNADEAEDLVQDVLLRVHAIRHTYDPERPFKPWLVAIAHRRAIDGLRRRKRIASREVGMPDDIETFAADASYHNIVPALDRRILEQAIGDLPPAQRTAVTMLRLRGLSLKEASAASGASVASLKVAVHRACLALKRKLGGGAA